jgi:hypothetical protein
MLAEQVKWLMRTANGDAAAILAEDSSLSSDY